MGCRKMLLPSCCRCLLGGAPSHLAACTCRNSQPSWCVVLTTSNNFYIYHQQVLPPATNSTPFLASAMPLTSSITNPFAHRPHHGTFQPHTIDELSQQHTLGSAQHSSDVAVYTRVFPPSGHSLPPPPQPSEQSFQVPIMLHSFSDLPPVSPAVPVYQDGQVGVA